VPKVSISLNRKKLLTTAKKFDSAQVASGIKIEQEHTRNRTLALKIALDHLKESPHYYTALKKMEKRLKK